MLLQESSHRSAVPFHAVKYLRVRESGTDDRYAYALMVPPKLAAWDGWCHWERARTMSMAKELQRGQVLIDIGAEQGWQSAVYGQIVGPMNMVLVEPSAIFWPTIKQIWTRTFPLPPRATIAALVGSACRGGWPGVEPWPAGADGPLSEDPWAYKTLLHNDPQLPVIAIDTLVERGRINPDALTMDVEGAEGLVLLGAQETLCQHRPLVWVSIHPDQMEKYGMSPRGIFHLMQRHGYASSYLGHDHEYHFLFKRRSAR